MAKLANFEVTFELKELKIHVKGDREIAPSIADNVGRHFATVLTPAGLIEAPKSGHSGNGSDKVIDAEAVTAPRRKRKSAAKSNASATGDGAAQITWSHDSTRWGSPVQTWKAYQKIAWLLHVVEQETGKKDQTPTELVETFHARFRDAGLLVKGNIPRDLAGKPDLFGSLDGRYFLKQTGKELAERLVNEAKGGAVAA
jgi:hypothetical protein